MPATAVASLSLNVGTAADPIVRYRACKAMARGYAESCKDEATRLAQARAFCALAINAYWSELCRHQGVDLEAKSLPRQQGSTFQMAPQLTPHVGAVPSWHRLLCEWPRGTGGLLLNGLYGAWYASNSREPIRDETLRSGFIVCRAVIERAGIPTTSSLPKYALDSEFAQLFDLLLCGDDLESAIASWRSSHLSKAALARQRLVKQGATVARDAVVVAFPNGELRTLAPGPSSVIAKAVIEVFAPRFLKKPAVLWLSESGNKVVARDDALARALGLQIDASRALPDIILIDLGDEQSGADMLVVFTEVVASDGPINRERKAVLTTLAVEAGFDERHLAFLTAFLDRATAPFKKSVPELAWGSYAWFASEPEHIVNLRDGRSFKLSEIALGAVHGRS